MEEGNTTNNGDSVNNIGIDIKVSTPGVVMGARAAAQHEDHVEYTSSLLFSEDDLQSLYAAEDAAAEMAAKEEQAQSQVSGLEISHILMDQDVEDALGASEHDKTISAEQEASDEGIDEIDKDSMVIDELSVIDTQLTEGHAAIAKLFELSHDEGTVADITQALIDQDYESLLLFYQQLQGIDLSTISFQDVINAGALDDAIWYLSILNDEARAALGVTVLSAQIDALAP